jgi:conjugation system TraG family ATPase
MPKSKTIEQVMPIYKVEQDCILSRSGDVTLAYELTLPELFTLGMQDYEAMHQGWLKAIRLLPPHTILHKQDWFIESRYEADFSREDATFLARSSEKHFNERPYLEHQCYLFLTQKPAERRSGTAMLSTLVRSALAPIQTLDAKLKEQFMDKCGQFVKVLQDAGYIQLRRLSDAEMASTADKPGLLERYCYLLHAQENPVIRDISVSPSLQVGDLHCQVFSLADTEDLPSLCGPRMNYDKYSTDKTKFSISFAAPLAQMLPCNHIYNQYIIIDDGRETLKKMESKRLRLQSLSSYSRENTISRDATNKFLNEAISLQRQPVKAHFNLLVWSSDPARSADLRNAVSAALSQLDARARQETTCAAQLFWSGMPGNAGDLPVHEAFDTFAEQAACFFNQESNYRSTISPVGVRFADRIYGQPVHVDISDWPVKVGICANRNKFILGGSGSGKSFLTNMLMRTYVEQNSHVVIVDVGHSYKGICDLLEGYYFTYSEQNPIKFNPFFLGNDVLDTEKKESIKTLLLSLWKRDDETFTRSEYVSLSNALQTYFEFLKDNPAVFPSFNSFYEYLRDIFLLNLRKEGIKEKDFDIDNFLYVLRPYYAGGEYDYLLNARENLDLLAQPMIVFELDNIKDHPILFPCVTIIIMEVFINKMRKLKGVRKVILIEEAWKALMRNGMAEYIKYLFKTVRKFYGEAIVVTQDVEDIISSPIVKQAIINNSDCKILLDQSKFQNKFDGIQELLGLTEKEKALVLSVNRANDPAFKYKEVFISLGGQLSKVYRTEVSPEEYYAFTTEEKEKMLVQAYAKKYGSLRRGISMLVREQRESQ